MMTESEFDEYLQNTETQTGGDADMIVKPQSKQL